MRRVTDIELMELVKERDVIAFFHTGSDQEARLSQHVESTSVRFTGMDVVEVHADDILDAANTCLGFVTFPRVVTFRSGNYDEEIVGFQAVASWLDG